MKKEQTSNTERNLKIGFSAFPIVPMQFDPTKTLASIAKMKTAGFRKVIIKKQA